MGYQEEASAGKPQPVYCAQHIDNHAHILHGYFAATARGDEESNWVTISVRLGETGNAVKLGFFRHHRADQIKEAIVNRLRLPQDARYDLINSAGEGVVVDGGLRADD
jgi:hypothetical protein